MFNERIFSDPLEVVDLFGPSSYGHTEGRNQLAEQAEKTVLLEHGFRWTAQDIAAVQPAFFFEIARWINPDRYLGIITRIWTHVGYHFVPKEGEEGEEKYYSLNNPLDPYWHEHFLNGLGFPIRWFLRLDTRRTNEPQNALYYRQQYEMPGIPYPDLATWADQRFAWGWTPRNTRLIVPENSVVRLFCGMMGNCWNDDDCNPRN